MMTGEQLTEGILQLAMQGRLVEQRLEEGTGQELYKTVQAEKDRLIKSGTIKRGKKSESIAENEMPFDIPETWTWARVDDIALLNPKNNLADDLDVSFVPMTLVDDGFSKKHTSEKRKWKDIKKGFTHFREGDIGVAKITPCFQNRKSVIFKNLINGYGAGTTELSIARPLEGLICSEFLLYVFKSKLFIDNGVKSFTGTAGQQRIHKDYLRTFVVPLPPLGEQKRIVAKIEELMPFVEQYAEASTRLNTLNTSFPDMMKKSILQEAVQGKLVPQDPNDEPASELLKRIKKVLPKQKPCKDELNFEAMEFELPGSWEWIEMNELFNFVDYRGKTPHKIEQGVFLVTASNIRQGYMDYTRKEYISEEEYQDRQSRGITRKGDLLFTTEAPMGNAAICDLEKCSCGQRIITFQPFCEGTAVPELFMHFILSPAFQAQLLSNCTGTTAKGIKADKLKHFKLPLPPLNEQKRIADKLHEILPTIKELFVE